VLTLDALRNLGPDVFAFILSFVIVGIYWVSHHNMLHLTKAVDHRLLWLNPVLLLAVILGQHLGKPIAVILDVVNLMAVNAVGTALWLYAGSHPDLMAESLSMADHTVRRAAAFRADPGVRGLSSRALVCRRQHRVIRCRPGVFCSAQSVS